MKWPTDTHTLSALEVQNTHTHSQGQLGICADLWGQTSVGVCVRVCVCVSIAQLLNALTLLESQFACHFWWQQFSTPAQAVVDAVNLKINL